jgi:glutamate racemase
MRLNNNPIGVFDSGLGGLTVVKELMRQLPREDIVYYGDTARVPYGTKSKESIIRFSIENARVLLRRRVKMIVVACNSSSSYALGVLRKKFSVPIVGVIHPGARKAVEVTLGRRVGVIATSATVRSRSYVKAIERIDPSVRVFAQACPLFVPIVEEGWMDKALAVLAAREYLKVLKKERVDALILGCTHYPLLKRTIRKVMGNKTFLVDSAREVAREVKGLLAAGGLGRSVGGRRRVRHQFLISDRPQSFERIAKEFLGREIKVTCCTS